MLVKKLLKKSLRLRMQEQLVSYDRNSLSSRVFIFSLNLYMQYRLRARWELRGSLVPSSFEVQHLEIIVPVSKRYIFRSFFFSISLSQASSLSSKLPSFEGTKPSGKFLFCVIFLYSFLKMVSLCLISPYVPDPTQL